MPFQQTIAASFHKASRIMPILTLTQSLNVLGELERSGRNPDANYA
jgi:hypothetical protein